MTSQEKAYLTLEEAAEYIGKKRASLYIYMNLLGIKTHKFSTDPRAYLSLEEVKRIKEFKAQPWIAGEKKRTHE